jgi:hypothetical protein
MAAQHPRALGLCVAALHWPARRRCRADAPTRIVGGNNPRGAGKDGRRVAHTNSSALVGSDQGDDSQGYDARRRCERPAGKFWDAHTPDERCGEGCRITSALPSSRSSQGRRSTARRGRCIGQGNRLYHRAQDFEGDRACPGGTRSELHSVLQQAPQHCPREIRQATPSTILRASVGRISATRRCACFCASGSRMSR